MDKYDSYSGNFGDVPIDIVMKDNKYGYIDREGNQITDLKYDTAYSFNNGVAIVCIDGKFGFINEKGEEIIPLKYDDCYYFTEELAPVMLNNKWGYVNKNKEEVIPLIYDECSGFTEGLGVVKLNNKYGIIDTKGKQVTDFKYDNIFNFNEGYAAANVDNKWGYIDKKGKEVGLEYFDCSSFYKGFAVIRVDDDTDYYFIDYNFKKIDKCFIEHKVCIDDSNKYIFIWYNKDNSIVYFLSPDEYLFETIDEFEDRICKRFDSEKNKDIYNYYMEIINTHRKND